MVCRWLTIMCKVMLVLLILVLWMLLMLLLQVWMQILLLGSSDVTIRRITITNDIIHTSIPNIIHIHSTSTIRINITIHIIIKFTRVPLVSRRKCGSLPIHRSMAYSNYTPCLHHLPGGRVGK